MTTERDIARSTPTPSAAESIVELKTGLRSVVSPGERMKDSYRIPVVATLLFVLTMVAIYFLGRQASAFYESVAQDGQTEFIGRS